MKVVRVLGMAAMIGLLAFVMNGCKPGEEKAAATAEPEAAVEEAGSAAKAAAKEDPATDKPKDHPAH